LKPLSMAEKEAIEALYVVQEENIEVNDIAAASFKLLRVRRELKGDNARLTEAGAMLFLKVLGDHLTCGNKADNIAAERLIRKEYQYARQFMHRPDASPSKVGTVTRLILRRVYHTSALIRRLEAEMTILDL